jgi:hypothetical protein
MNFFDEPRHPTMHEFLRSHGINIHKTKSKDQVSEADAINEKMAEFATPDEPKPHYGFLSSMRDSLKDASDF